MTEKLLTGMVNHIFFSGWKCDEADDCGDNSDETPNLCGKIYISFLVSISLRKYALAIYSDFLSCKNSKFQWKNFDIFNIFLQNIDCQCMFETPH